MNLEEQIAARIEAFRDQIERDGIDKTGDDRVSEEDAARLLNIKHRRLKDWRLNYPERGPKHHWLGTHGHRLSYRLDELARWLEEQQG